MLQPKNSMQPFNLVTSTIIIIGVARVFRFGGGGKCKTCVKNKTIPLKSKNSSDLVHFFRRDPNSRLKIIIKKYKECHAW